MMNCRERMVESSICEEPESERICFQQNLDLAFGVFSSRSELDQRVQARYQTVRDAKQRLRVMHY